MDRIRLLLTNHWKRIAAFTLVLIFLACSVTFLAQKFTNPETYRKTIQSIDEKKVTVLGVSAAIAGSATLLASVPDDATTPLAEEMMDLSSYLIAVVCVLVLEKSLLTVFGAAACYVLFPIACIFALIFIVNNKKFFMAWAIKLSILALAFLIIVPSSMKLSDYIYEVNQVSFEQGTETVVDSTETESSTKEDLPWYKKLWNTITNAVKDTAEAAVEHGKKVLNEFIDAVSAFVIAYCAIPVFVVFLFLWLLKFLFGLNINVNLDSISPKRLREKKMKKAELEALSD